MDSPLNLRGNARADDLCATQARSPVLGTHWRAGQGESGTVGIHADDGAGVVDAVRHRQGPPPIERVLNVPFGLRMKLVNRVGMAALSDEKPTRSPFLSIPLTVVPPTLFPGPSNEVKL